jgi:hypothetical protein
MMHPPAMMKITANLCYGMFQSYDFKFNLGLSFLANYKYMYTMGPTNLGEGISGHGV